MGPPRPEARASRRPPGGTARPRGPRGLSLGRWPLRTLPEGPEELLSEKREWAGSRREGVEHAPSEGGSFRAAGSRTSSRLHLGSRRRGAAGGGGGRGGGGGGGGGWAEAGR